MKLLVKSVLLLLLALAAPQLCGAQSLFYGAQKSEFGTQTQDDTAPAIDNYSVYAFVQTNGTGTADSISVTDSNTEASIDMQTSDQQNFSGSNFYSTLGEMDADFVPGNDYVFTATGGSLDGQSDQLPITADAFTAQLYLTGTSLSQAAAANPSNSLTLTFAPQGVGATSTSVSFSILDPSNGLVYSLNTTQGAGSFTIPQSVLASLTPGEDYTGQLANFNTSDVPTTGDFSDDDNSDGFVSTTDFTIATVPEPASVPLIALAGLLLVGRRFFRLRRS